MSSTFDDPADPADPADDQAASHPVRGCVAVLAEALKDTADTPVVSWHRTSGVRR